MDSIGIELSPRETVERAHERMSSWLEGRQLDPSPESDSSDVEQRWQEDLAERPEYWALLDERRRLQSYSARVRVVDSRTREKPRAGEITQTVLQFVTDSTREITLISPYFVLGESLTSALEQAAERGVRITVLTNSPLSSDNAIAQALFLEQWPTLLSRVPSMRLFVIGGEDTLHSKILLFDRVVSLVGTYNLDPTAMQMNSELMVGLWSEPLNRHFRQQVEERIAVGAPAVYRYRIQLAADGRPELDSSGKPQVAFGPQDHLTEEQLETIRDTRRVIDGIRQALGLEPLVEPRPPGDAR
jgi:phosphatidylserine/phosphatidylglycerophosphate/cardiolipin synthase-like enzyme